MTIKTAPTKGNLLAEKKKLELARTGYELMDRKRNILIREMMQLIDKAKEIQGEIEETFAVAYDALRMANITTGICMNMAEAVPEDTSMQVRYRSVMGVEIPLITIGEDTLEHIPYGLTSSNSALDEAYIRFVRVKHLSALFAEVENSVYRLADAIKKTQKRANALKNIIIPESENTVKEITSVLEEKEREEFARMKLIKQMKMNS